jgi:hypothetical protein
MRFAHGADALQIAQRRWFEPSDFFRIEIKIGHSAQQKIRRFRALFGHCAQFGGRHPNVPRHALDFRFVAAPEIRLGSSLEPSSTPREQGLKSRLVSSFLGWRKHLSSPSRESEELEVWRCQGRSVKMSRVDISQSPRRVRRARFDLDQSILPPVS